MNFINKNKKPKSFLVLGNSRLTKAFTDEINKQFFLSGVISTTPEKRQLNSLDLKKYCEQKKIKFLTYNNLNSERGNLLLKKFKPDFIVSTWPYILSKNTVNIPKCLFIGTHPTNLPSNRGRHPLHWLICLGFKTSKISFFKIDSKVDHGPLLIQKSFKVFPDKPISATEKMMIKSAKRALRKLLKMLKNNSISTKMQNHRNANYWRKRTVHDVILDPRMDHNVILRTVNSFCKPYPEAILIFNDQIYRIKKARVLPSPPDLKRMEFGRIKAAKKNMLILRMGNRLIELHLNKKIPLITKKNNCVHPPSYYKEIFTIY